jgi:hypothetical protein
MVAPVNVGDVQHLEGSDLRELVKIRGALR